MHILKSGYGKADIDKTRIALMGDSAGGGLVATLTHRLRKKSGISQPKVSIFL